MLIQGFLQFLPDRRRQRPDVRRVARRDVLAVAAAHARDARGRRPRLLFTALRLRTAVFPASWDAQQRAGEVANVVEEAVTGVRVVKGFGQEQRELDRLTERSRTLFAVAGAPRRTCRRGCSRRCRRSPRSARSRCSRSAAGSRSKATSASARSSPSRRTCCCSSPPVRMLAAILTVAQLARAGAERIFDLLDSTPLVQDRPDAAPLPDGRGEVRFDDVTFGYLRTEPVLRDFSLTVAPGETVALVGTSGSGKSTVGLLLPRFYDVHARHRHASTTSTSATSTLHSLRQQIGVVFEDSFLFSDTIRTNIAFGAARRDAGRGRGRGAGGRGPRVHHAPARRLRHRRRRAGSDAVGRPAPAHRARARAAVATRAILLLDDATSSVDARVEEEIHATLRRLAIGRTTILIAHRRSTLSLADRIVVVDERQVVDSGTHDELIARCTLYRKLLAGPGDDVEGIDAASRPTPTQRSRRPPAASRRAAWRGLDRRGAARSRHRRPTARAPRARSASMGGGGRWRLARRDGRRARADARAAREGRRAAARRRRARRRRRRRRRARDPNFKFLRFLKPYRRAARRRARPRHARRRSARSLGPAARALRHRPRRGRRRRSRRSVVASGAFLAVTLVDWWVMWAQARVMGRTSERMLYALRRQGVRAPPAARHRLLRAGDGGPGHDPHDDRHRLALAAPADTGSSPRWSTS